MAFGRSPGEHFALTRDGEGYFAGEFVPVSEFYAFMIDSSTRAYPDPASRFQPTGPHGCSQLINPSTFEWRDTSWKGPKGTNHVLYELHIGTFTREGTWSAAAEQVQELANLGITVIELMPVAEFPGKFGWGYDGVNWFAPTHLYGTPDDMRRFIETAHLNGIGVILDVVYNHFGPCGNYLPKFSPYYFSTRYKTDWGEAINYDGEQNREVRNYVLTNVRYWVEEFHLDGLRLDATQQIYDCSETHIIKSIAETAKHAAGEKQILLVAENEKQDTLLARPIEKGGFGLSALWNDDFHHSALVALTGKNEAYYSDYRGSPQEFVSAAKYGYLFQGQRYHWQKNRRGTPSDGLSSYSFVTFIENHDQVANSARGLRLHQLSSPGKYRAMAALLLLFPGMPMLFQGQEFASLAPFLYFADQEDEHAETVANGRLEFLKQFESIKEEMWQYLRRPDDEETFLASKIDFAERGLHCQTYTFHRDLLHLRRTEAAFNESFPVDGAVIGTNAFLLRYFSPKEAYADRLLLVNFGQSYNFQPCPEPLLAPPRGMAWKTLWSSEWAEYGGSGAVPLEREGGWHISGEMTSYLEVCRRES